MVIRDEDHIFKKELFKQIWPSVIDLYKADALGLRSVARYLFDFIDSLYIYLPNTEKKQIERKLIQWRKNATISSDHPINIDPSIERILKQAKIRKKR